LHLFSQQGKTGVSGIRNKKSEINRGFPFFEKSVDQFDVARKKHYSLLGKSMIDWTGLNFCQVSLSDLYYLMASPETRSMKRPILLFLIDFATKTCQLF